MEILSAGAAVSSEGLTRAAGFASRWCPHMAVGWRSQFLALGASPEVRIGGFPQSE